MAVITYKFSRLVLALLCYYEHITMRNIITRVETQLTVHATDLIVSLIVGIFSIITIFQRYEGNLRSLMIKSMSKQGVTT